MKASELRMGNFIHCNDSICTVECITSKKFINEGNSRVEESELELFTEGYFFESNTENTYGIFLTEEWLVKFGFKPSNFLNGNILHTLGVLHLLLSDSPNSYGCSFEPENNNSWFTEVNYVHQLQNLYFALTGEELTIKEPAV